MADPSATSDPKAQGGIPTGKAQVVVPAEAEKKYPELVRLILKSESMNVEEQNYWLQVLPVMTPEQVTELKDILQTEKQKLAAIDAKYSPQKGTPEKEIDVKEIEEKRRAAREKRAQAEAQHRTADKNTAEELLSKLDEL